MSVFLIDFRFSLLVSGFVSFHLVCFDFSTTLTLRLNLSFSLYATLSHSLTLSLSLFFPMRAWVCPQSKKVFIWLCRVRRVRGCQTMRRRWNNTAKCIERGRRRMRWGARQEQRLKCWQAALAAHLGLLVQAEVAVYTIVIFRKSGRDEDATPSPAIPPPCTLHFNPTPCTKFWQMALEASARRCKV